MLFDDMIVLDCDAINIESSADRKEDKKESLDKKKRR